MPPVPPLHVQFGPYTYDAARCLLTRGGAGVHLTRKAFMLFGLLLQQRPAVVPKRQIMDHLWPDCFVSEDSIASLVSEIRTALGADGKSLIRTAHGIGYGFAGEATDSGPALPAEGARFVLIEKGPPPRSIHLQEGTIVIGRGLSCQVRVASGTVSREHARIRLAEGAATLEDLRSRNGTYLRGKKVTDPVRLAHGDDIRLGTVDLIFRSEAAPEGETESVG